MPALTSERVALPGAGIQTFTMFRQTWKDARQAFTGTADTWREFVTARFAAACYVDKICRCPHNQLHDCIGQLELAPGENLRTRLDCRI